MSQHDPLLVSEHGWVPELLVIDYALTQDRRSVDERVAGDNTWLDRLSPLPRLRSFAASLPGKAVERRPIPVQAAAGSEYWGCLVGGLLLNTFAEHPCAPITVTRYSQQILKEKAADVAFFEYLMEVQSSGLLKAQGRSASPTWQEVLEPGMFNLRCRLRALAKAGIAWVSLDDVLALTDTNTEHPVLTVTSKFGRRRLPVDGLFIDMPETKRASEAATWARKLIQEAWYDSLDKESGDGFDTSLEALKLGKKVASDLWDAYDGKHLQECVESRLQMSHLLALSEMRGGREHLGEADAAKLEDCLRRFGVATPGDADCTMGYCDLRESCADAGAQRWAVLLSLVRLMHLRHEAIKHSHELPKEVLADGNRLPFEKAVDADDLYLLLFPIPKNPLVLPWHAADPNKAKNAWQQSLSRLGIAPKRLLEKGEGLRAGERLILRMYAASLGYDWNDDRSVPAQNVLGTP